MTGGSTAYAFMFLLEHPQRDLETEHRDRDTLDLAHCGHSYGVTTSEKPVGAGNNEYSCGLTSADRLSIFSVFWRTRAYESRINR